MLGYKVITRITSRQDGMGEVVVSKGKGNALVLAIDIIGDTKIYFRDPDVSWEEKCRLQHAEWAIPHKERIKLAVFMHFGGMYYRYDAWTSILTIRHLSTRTIGCIILILALLAIQHIV